LLGFANLLLLGAALGLSLSGLIAVFPRRRQARLWCAKFVAILLLILALALTRLDLAGLVALPTWLLLIYLPSLGLVRSIRAVLFEDFERAARWARLAQLLHPGDGVGQQVELQGALRQMHQGNVEDGLAQMRALDERLPGHDFWFPVDADRFHGRWENVRAWMERELEDAVRAGQIRHSLTYLRALGETGDLPAMLAFYGEATPHMRSLRSCRFPDYALLILAVAFGRGEVVERLLRGTLRDMPKDSQSACRAATRMATGDVEGGRAELAALREQASFENRTFIDRRLALAPALPAEVFGGEDEARRRFDEVVSGATARPRRARILRLIRIAAGLVLVVLGLLVLAPWRAKGPADERGRRLTYLERVVGRGAGEVTAQTPLPMLVDVHGYCSFPELHGRSWGALDRPVRLIVPAGPERVLIGRSWFAYEDEGMSEAIADSTARLAALIEHLCETRPTLGAPLVTGFSQGGTLSFALAAGHSGSIGAAFPVAGWLPLDLIPEHAPERPASVLALHGADDAPEWCQGAVDALAERGWNAKVRLYPGVDHTLTSEMRADRLAAVVSAMNDG
jgi:phospholipase/carboxylesterase